MLKKWESPSVAKSPQKRLCSAVVVLLFFAALLCNILLDDRGLSKNTEFDTKLLSKASDTVLDNYKADEFLDYDQSTSKAAIIRGEWNWGLENIDSFAATTTQLEEDLWMFTFNSASDAYIITGRMEEDNQYCFEAVFDVSDTESVMFDNVDFTESVFETEETETETGRNRKPVTIAVLDTGYSGNSEKVLKGFSVIDNAFSIEDKNGHGTRIIDIIDEMTADNVSILPIKVANEDGFATILSVTSGIKIAMEQNADVINISMNAYTSDSAFILEEAIKEADNAGIKVVVSAGNKGTDVANIIPSNIEEAIVVSAVSVSDEFESYSNYGETVDYATYGNRYGIGGTSISAARFSAMLGYVLGEELDETIFDDVAYYPEVDDTIKTASNTLGQYTYETIEPELQFGAGIINPLYIYQNDTDIAETAMSSIKARTETTWVGRTEYDIGPNIINLDWKSLDTEELDAYLMQTHYAFVGELFAHLSDSELELLVSKSDIAKTNVQETEFAIDSDSSDSEVVEGDIIGERNVNFVDYCLEEYNLHKDDLVISSSYWWYNNTGALYLRDNHGSTKFTLYAPKEKEGQSILWDAEYSLDGNHGSYRSYDKYMKISKTSGAESSPNVKSAAAVKAGFESYIKIQKIDNEVSVNKHPTQAAQKLDSGEESYMWQFVFENYDVGEAEIGEHFYYFGENSADSYDINVRPYGYWTENWQTNGTGKPSGKLRTNSECSVANEHVTDPTYQALMSESIQYWDPGLCQGYVYIDAKKSTYSSVIQSVRKRIYTTTELNRADTVDIIYFNGASNISYANILSMDYQGETKQTKLQFEQKYPEAKWQKVSEAKDYQGLFQEDRYIPLFSSSDYPLSDISKLELYKVSPVWYHKAVTASDITNEDVTIESSKFTVADIAIAGKKTSYDYKKKTVTLTAGLQALGFSDTDYGENSTKTTESDTPELYIQTAANQITVQYGVDLTASLKGSGATEEDWINKTRNLTNVPSDPVKYGEEDAYSIRTYAPAISGFTDSGVVEITYYNADNVKSSQTYTDVKTALKSILKKETGGTLYVTRIYNANLSTLVVDPGNGSFTYNGVKYTTNNPLVIQQTPGTTFVLGEPNATGMNLTATFLNADLTGTYKTIDTSLTWDVSSPWKVSKGTKIENSYVVVSGTANGKVESNNKATGANLYAYAPIGTKGQYYTSAGNGDHKFDEYWSLQGNWITAEPGYYYISIPCGEKVYAYMNNTGNFKSGCRKIFDLKYTTLNKTTYFRASILDLYSSSVKQLNENGGISSSGNTAYYQVIHASKDWTYQFGTVKDSIDIVSPNLTGNTIITLPAGPAKTGATFIGWVATEHENESYNGEKLAAGTQIDLSQWGNAVFKPMYSDVYTITLLPDVSKLTTVGTTIIYEKYGVGLYKNLECTVPITEITVPTYSDGVSFTGYYDNVGVGPYINEDGTFDTTKLHSTSFSRDTTLYGYSALTSYKITLDKNGITSVVTCDDLIKEYYDRYWTNADGNIITKIGTPAAYGYVFKGYFTQQLKTNEVLETDIEPVIGTDGTLPSNTTFSTDTTLYAAWIEGEYDVYLDFNDGTVLEKMEGYSVKYGNVSETMDTFTYVPVRPGYTFMGWYDEAVDGNLVYNPTTGERTPFSKYFDANGRYIYYKDMILYAHWNQVNEIGGLNSGGNQYTVTYDGSFNGIAPTGGSTPDSTHYYDIEQALTLNGYEMVLTVIYQNNDGDSSTTSTIPETSVQTIGTFMGWTSDIYIANKLTIDSHSGIFVADSETENVKEITVTKNLAGSELTVTSSNEEIAVAEISENKITVTALTSGQCTITLTSAATDKYAETTATYYVFVQ